MPMTLPISSQVYLPAAARSVFASSSAPLPVLLFPHQHFVEHLSAPSGAAEQPSRGVKERQPKKRFKKLNGSELAHSSHSLRILCLAQSCPRIVRSYYCNTLSRECAHTFNCRVKERHDKLPISPFFVASSRVLCLWLA